MKGTVRFLLLTLLATAATATFEYDLDFVDTSLAQLRQLDMVDYELHNTRAPVHWILTDKTDDNIHFKANPQLYRGHNCNQMPALTLYDGPTTESTPGPMMCLAQMNFTTTTTHAGAKRLSLVLGFVKSEFPDNLRAVFFDVWKKPSNEVLVVQGVVEAEPINQQDAIVAGITKYFVGSASWLDNLFGRGICKLRRRQPSGTQPMLKGYPIIMNPETLDQILAV